MTEEESIFDPSLKKKKKKKKTTYDIESAMAEGTGGADGDGADASATDKENMEPSKTEDMDIDDNLDLDNFGRKKKKKKKKFNLEELDGALPDTMGKTKDDGIDGGMDDEAIEDSLSHRTVYIDMDLPKKKKKKKRKMGLDELVALEEKKEKDLEDKEHGKYTNHKGKKGILTNPEELEEQRRGKKEKKLKGKKEKLKEVENPNRVRKKVKKQSKPNEVVNENTKTELSREEGKSCGKPIGMAKELEPLLFDSENTSREGSIAIKQYDFQQDLKPPPWLQCMESPLKWAGTLKKVLMYYLMFKKLHDYRNQGAFYGFEKFAILLVIILGKLVKVEIHSKDNSNKESEADESTEENIKEERAGDEGSEEDVISKYDYNLEDALTKCEETIEEMAATNDGMYMRIGPVFHHVLGATKAHILFLERKVAESREMAGKIENVEVMSSQAKAGIYGLRAKFIMSMYQDYTVLIPLLSRAIELDPTFGYWHYLSGKVIRRLRREYNEKMVIEELDHFERAVELERNPKFLVFLAQAYQELANTLINAKDTSISATVINNFLEKSVELFRECWQLKNDTVSIAQRVGNGLMKMKRGFIDKKVAKEALLKADELSLIGPNLALGKYYYNHEQNDEKALEYFHKDAPSNFATPEIIRLNLIKDPSYDPLDVLLEWVDCSQGTLKQHAVLCDCGWYYLMYKKDLKTAVKYFWEVLKMDYNSFKVTEYESYGFFVQGPINMVEVLVNEILLAKMKNETLPVEERENVKILERFLEKVFEKHPNLQDLPLTDNLLDNLKMEVERRIAYFRKKRYGSIIEEMDQVKGLRGVATI